MLQACVSLCVRVGMGIFGCVYIYGVCMRVWLSDVLKEQVKDRSSWRKASYVVTGNKNNLMVHNLSNNNYGMNKKAYILL